MHPRLVDWLLLAMAVTQTLSGLVTFLIGKPEGEWFFWLHGAFGLSMVVLVYWKMARVFKRVRMGMGGIGSIVSLSVFLLVILAIGTGISWVSFQEPVGYPNGLNLHVISGLLLLVLISLHTLMRHKPISMAVVRSRRNLMSTLWAGGLGLGAYIVQQQMARRFNLRGAHRRFTGSREAEGSLPVTMWMFDTVPSIDQATWKLAVSGEVQNPMIFSWDSWLEQPTVEESVVLDCTGGWFKEDLWEGVPVSHLIDSAGILDSGRWVGFTSVTGYRWSLTLEEARKATLASRLNGELLTPAHGFPVRLVSPGNRGFQWVKWVSEVNVLSEMDLSQWGAIFTSGLRQ